MTQKHDSDSDDDSDEEEGTPKKTKSRLNPFEQLKQINGVVVSTIKELKHLTDKNSQVIYFINPNFV